MMGSPDTEPEKEPDEILHQVKLTGFWILETPVTQRMFMLTKKINPAAFCATGQRQNNVTGMNTDDFPIEQVSWNEAEMFCKRITQFCRQEHYLFSLPTEAQWEYACRAGTNTPFYYGDTLMGKANYDTRITYLQEPTTRNCPRCPTTVRTYQSNSWGIYDMHGNVYEWCSDWYDNYPYAPRKTQ